MRYTTSLRSAASRRLEELGRADLVVGIPCYNNQSTIEHVIKSVSEGLSKYYPDMRSLVMISDGGSTDDTREIARGIEMPPYLERIAQVYRGLPGKGSALRAIFEASSFLNVKACAVVDSDLRSITPAWIKALLQPVIDGDYHFVAPLYTRHKYDGTITNNFAYSLTRSLFGKRIRQPIGGDFGFSHKLARYYANEGDWDSDIARFGIDIWMTISAITQGLPICQAHLGVKVHDAKDPGESLGPMFRQVSYTLFSLMDREFDYWSKIKGSDPVPTFEEPSPVEPEPITVNVERMIELFKEGFERFGALWSQIVKPENYAKLNELYKAKDSDFYMSTYEWARIVYDFAATFHVWERYRTQLVDMMSPLYYSRVASFVIKTTDMSNAAAEKIVEEQAQQFEDLKPYLLENWNRLVPAVGQTA